MTSTNLELATQHAIDLYLTSCTIPLVQEGHGQVAVLGTANLFRVLGRTFLVTANHSFNNFEPESVGIPVALSDGQRICATLDNCRRYYWPDERLDVAIVEVLNPSLLASIDRTGYIYLGPEDVAPYQAGFEQYVLVGFPSAVAIVKGNNLWPRAVKITTSVFLGTPPENFSARDEFLLVHELAGETKTGETVESFRLNGVSGAAVWGIKASPTCGVWQPNQHIRLVGVQTACLHGTYIRGQQWWLAARMFQKISPELGNLFLQRMDSREEAP